MVLVPFSKFFFGTIDILNDFVCRIKVRCHDTDFLYNLYTFIFGGHISTLLGTITYALLSRHELEFMIVRLFRTFGWKMFDRSLAGTVFFDQTYGDLFMTVLDENQPTNPFMEINGCVSADKVGLHQSRGQRDTNLRGFLERLFVVVLSGGYPMGFKWRMTYPP